MLNNKYTVGDLFAGAGGLSKAFQLAGANIIWANEIDSNACSLYRENLECNCLVEGDIKEIDAKSIPNFDILVAGFPCQSFSIAGRNRGFDNERDYLFFDILRILKDKTPKAFLLESVKALKSLNHGNTFRDISKAFMDEGYYIKYIMLNTLEYGNTPHNKERMFIVGFRDINYYQMFEFPEAIQLTMKIEDIIDVRVQKEKKYYYGKSIEQFKKIKGDSVKKDRIYQLKYQPSSEERYIVKEYNFCPPLTSVIMNVPLIIDSFNIRKLTPMEYFNFQGYFNINIPTKINDSRLYKYAAECSSVVVVKRIAENILKTLDYKMQSSGVKRSFLYDVENLNYEIQQETPINNKEEFIPQNIVTNQIQQNMPIDNEREFTLQKVIPALKKKDFFDVRYSHGSDEYGKDVTYKYNDNFGITRYGAVQVKYGDISGSVKGEIDPILFQIEDTFEIPYIDIKESRKNYINQLLIICSGRYTRNAKEKIMEKLKKGYDIRFLDGQDIDNLLD